MKFFKKVELLANQDSYCTLLKQGNFSQNCFIRFYILITLFRRIRAAVLTSLQIYRLL